MKNTTFWLFYVGAFLLHLFIAIYFHNAVNVFKHMAHGYGFWIGFYVTLVLGSGFSLYKYIKVGEGGFGDNTWKVLALVLMLVSGFFLGAFGAQFLADASSNIL